LTSARGKLIENRWNLQPLGARDANALTIGTALDFEQQPRTAPEYEVAPILAGTACPATAAPMTSGIRVGNAAARVEADEWSGLYDLARNTGWNIP
jgi:hypothetical protein